jgi:serine/threonine protein kinase
MGEVWLGEHVQLHFRVALKVLRKDALSNHELVARFSREAFLLGQIHSDHVARAIDFVSGRHGPVLVMEFIEGPSLSVVLRSKRFTVEEAIGLGIDIASALRELHAANVIHRDVKPSNIILRPQRGGTHRAVFVDLGVSRLVPEERDEEDEKLTEITSDDRAIGTMEYMAPEQILSSRSVTPGADLYALGAILFRAITGHHVYGNEHGVALARKKLSTEPPPLRTGRSDRVALGFEALVARTLAPSPEDRYEVADEILADLSLLRDMARHVAMVRVRPSPPPPLPRPGKPKGRKGRRGVLRAVVAAGLVLFAATSLTARASSPHDSAPPPIVSAVARGAAKCVVENAQTEEGATPDGMRRVSFAISCEEPGSP